MPRSLKRDEHVKLAGCDFVLFKLILCFEKCSHVPDERLRYARGNSIDLLGTI
jgi:hypothetical protein